MTTDLTIIPNFFYGSPAKFALVDAMSYRLWLVDSTDKFLISIKNAFSSKRNFVVVQLANDKETILDNSVVLNWQFIKKPALDYFPGKDSLFGFNKVIKDNSWAIADQANYSDSDADLFAQLLLYYHLLIQFTTGDSGILKTVWEEILPDLNDFISRGLTLEDMHNNLFELANDLYARKLNFNASNLFHVLPTNKKYE